MQRRLILGWGVSLTITGLLLAVAALEAKRMLNSEPILQWGPGIFPLRSFDVRMDDQHFKKFEMLMRQYADTFAFENKSRQSSPDPDDVFFIFRRSDIDVLASRSNERVRVDLKYNLGFYPKESRSPPPPENVNVLVEGLKKFISPIEGVVMTEVPTKK